MDVSKLQIAKTLGVNPKRKILGEMNVFEPPKKVPTMSQSGTVANFSFGRLQGQRQCIMSQIVEALKNEQELSLRRANYDENSEN